MNQTIESRLEALGRQAVCDAARPAPTALLSAVQERQASRRAVRLTLVCSAVACFLITGVVAYVALPGSRPAGVPGGSGAVAVMPGSESSETPAASEAPSRGESGPRIHAAAPTGAGESAGAPSGPDKPVIVGDPRKTPK